MDHPTTQQTHRAYLDTCAYLYSNPITGFLQRFSHWLAARLTSRVSGNILDIGCGKGDHFPFMRGKNIVGFDIDGDLLAIARREYPIIPLVQGDIYQMPFFDDAFEGAVSVCVFEHLRDLPRACREIRRVLRPEAELVVVVPMENFLYRLGRSLTVKRYIEKRHAVRYDQLVGEEHVNDYAAVLQALKENFHVTAVRGVPFLIPFTFCNFFMAVRCKNKK